MTCIFNTFLMGGGRLRAIITILSGLLFCAVGPAIAQSSLSLSQALQQTLLDNPDLQEFPYQLRIREARTLQAATKPSPVLELEAENLFAGTSGNRLEDPFESSDTTLALSQVIELGDKRARRMEQVRASTEALYAQYELTRLEVLAETARRYYDVLRQQQLQAWMANRIALEQEALATARGRANAGALAQAEVSRLQLRLARSESQQLNLAGLLALARLRLAAMWGSAEPVPEVSSDLALLPEVPAIEELQKAVDKTPRFLRLATSRRLAAADLRLQKSRDYMDPTVSIGVRHLGVEDDDALVFSLDLPLRQRARNRGNVAEAQAQLDLHDARQTLLSLQITATIGQIHQAMANKHAMATRLQEQLLPLSRQLLDDIGAGYAQGQFDVVQWLDAQSELVELERELIEARYAVHLQLLELEQLTGQSLTDNAKSMLQLQPAQETTP